MKTLISILTMLILALLVGCSSQIGTNVQQVTPSSLPPGETSFPGEATRPSTIQPAATPSVPGETSPDNPPAISWERQGGKERACLRLAIYRDGSYTLDDCSMQGQVNSGMLSADQFAPLQEKLQRYGVFEWSTPVQKGLVDLVLDRYGFYGQGSESMPLDEQGALNTYLAKLAIQLSLAALPPNQSIT